MNNRRDFLKTVALAAGTGAILGGCGAPGVRGKKAGINMSGYCAPKIPTVRVGFVGLGLRGPGAVERMMHIEGVEITAICDKRRSCTDAVEKMVAERGFPKPAVYTDSEDAWKEMCLREDLDLIYIVTPWELHTPMSVYAMEHGKHAAVEVPAGLTIDECWQLVETSERTRKHCVILENCCYDFFELLTLNMARQGFFGDVIHTEGAYIHDLLKNNFGKDSYSDMWRLRENQQRNGSLYPTHGIGPVCQILNVNRGDKMDYLTSMSTNDFQMGKIARELAAEDGFFESFATDSYRGNMNTTTIRTNKGKTIMIQHDVTSPRPYSRIHLVSGTEGFARKYPLPGKIAKGHSFFDADEMKVLEKEYTPEIVKLVGDMAKQIGGHGGMDFMMDWRLIDCLRNGIPLDQDVYDAALWSVVAPLSEWSVANRSNSIEIPDFSNGSWKTNEPVDVELKRGGTTGVRVAAEAESQLNV